jgi:PhnB protein
MSVQPYLFFNGRCEEAVAFYRKALNAEVTMLMHFKDSPEPAACPTGKGDKVMHMEFRIGKTSVMASDGQCEGPLDFKGFALTISVSSDAEAEKVFAALTPGGQVLMPMAKTFFSSRFGMVTDRFGVMWMVIVAKE